MIKHLSQYDKIYVFVSGGIDSTYLYIKLKKFYNDKVIPVNCFNPFESNKTLNRIKQLDPLFISLKSKQLKLPYKQYIINAFIRIPFAINRLIIKGQYDKKTNFKCCYYIKHKALMEAKKLTNDNVVFISGIKAGDGKQRALFLSQLRKGSYKSLDKKEPTFFLKHKKTNMIYAYPFRDFTQKEFPSIVLRHLRKIFPEINHSGCYFCPVLVMFGLNDDAKRYNASIILAKKLNVNQNYYKIKNTIV